MIKTALKKLDMIMEQQDELFSTEIFTNTRQQEKYTAHRLETVTAFLESQGISPRLISQSLSTLHKTYRHKGRASLMPS
jgi:hypothetical protein